MTLDLKRGKVLLVVLVVLFNFLIIFTSPNLNLIERVEGATTTQFFAETTDGYIGCTSTVNYADCRAGTTLNTDTSNNMSVGQWFSVVPANTWAIQRAGVEFDMTSIPSDATISSATFGVMWATDTSTTDFILRLHSSNWTSGGLTNADWTMLLDGAAIGSIASSADYSADTWITISVPTAFINRTGNTQFSIISWEDTNNSAPTDEEFTDLWHADMIGTDYDPYLNVTYNSAPVISNCPSDAQNGKKGTLYEYEFTSTDADSDSITWSLSGLSWGAIDSSTGILTGNPNLKGIYESVTVTADDGTTTDTCTFDIRVTEEEGGGSSGQGKFDFKVRQISERELLIWITETRRIPKDRLDFKWEIQTGSNYEGEVIEVTLNEDLTWGESIWINLSATTKNTTYEMGNVNKQYTSNFVPIWLFILILSIALFLVAIALFGKRIKRVLISTKKKSKAWVRKVKAVGKSIGWGACLLLGITMVWTPSLDPTDAITLWLIATIGMFWWVLIGAILVLLCVIVLGKKIYKRIKTGRW